MPLHAPSPSPSSISCSARTPWSCWRHRRSAPRFPPPHPHPPGQRLLSAASASAGCAGSHPSPRQRASESCKGTYQTALAALAVLIPRKRYSNKCLTSSNKKLVETMTLQVTMTLHHTANALAAQHWREAMQRKEPDSTGTSATARW